MSTDRRSTALVLDDVPIPSPEAGEVRVRVQAIPLNLNDLERITGGNMMVRPELPYSPGMEVMGIVDACGDGAGEWQGRRVVAMPKGAHGGFAEYAICPVVSAFEMPDTIPLPDAAALYFPFHLAWLGLFDRAELQAGESVLIHAAAGGSGSAAVQLAKHAGARVFATAGTDAKVALCRELGADVAINYNDADFAEVVLAETERPRRRRRVRQRRRSGDGSVDEVRRLQRPLPDDGVRLQQGGRRRAVHRAAPHRARELQALRRAARVRAARHGPAREDRDGLELRVRRTRRADHARDRRPACVAGEIKAVVGEVVAFEDLPDAIDAMANRATIGRTIVKVEWPD